MTAPTRRAGTGLREAAAGAPSAGSAPLSVTHYNRDIPWLDMKTTGEEQSAIEEMLNIYSPFGEIRTVMAALRPGLGVDGYQGSATPMSLDHALRRLIGLSGLRLGLDRDIYGGGKGLTLNDSALSSLGEAIERMLGAFSGLEARQGEDEWVGTSRELSRLNRRHVGPADLELFAPEQFLDDGFLCEPWTPDSRVTWSRGTNLLDGEDHWVPSQLVHLFYIRSHGEARLGGSSSGGLATHLNRERAISHGVMELVERDAINLSWYCRVLPERIEIDVEPEDPKLKRWLDSARRAGMDVTFYSHRTDVPGVCVITAIAFDDSLEENSYMSGGGVGFSAEKAMRSAVAELIQSERMVRPAELAPSWRMVTGFKRMFGIDAEAGELDFDNFIQVVPYYGYAENRHRLNWYFNSPQQPSVKMSALPERKFQSSDEEYAAILDLCREAGFTPVAFDFTPDSFRHVSLQKVFIPELVPAFAPNNKMLGHRRYSEFPRILGLTRERLTFDDLTREPLPFP